MSDHVKALWLRHQKTPITCIDADFQDLSNRISSIINDVNRDTDDEHTGIISLELDKETRVDPKIADLIVQISFKGVFKL